jgi:hypothetical protein
LIALKIRPLQTRRATPRLPELDAAPRECPHVILCATYRNHERRCDSPAAPGLLATIGFRDATGDDSEPPLRIFGPRGIKALVRTALCLSDTRLTLRFSARAPPLPHCGCQSTSGPV